MKYRRPNRFLPLVALTTSLLAASAGAQDSQASNLDEFLNALEGIGASEVSLTPPSGGGLEGYAERLDEAILLNQLLRGTSGEASDLTTDEWRSLRLLAEARSFSEAKLLARIVYTPKGEAPQVPAELSDDPNDPNWQFEDFAAEFPEYVTEALAARLKGRDRVVDELSDREFDSYARFESLIYRTQRQEAAIARDRTFDGRDDL